jgi:hypothetical protein
MNLNQLFPQIHLAEPNKIHGPYCSWEMTNDKVVITATDGQPLEKIEYVAFVVDVGRAGVIRQKYSASVVSDSCSTLELQPVTSELRDYLTHLGRYWIGGEPRRRDGLFNIEKRRRDWVVRSARPLFLRMDPQVASQYQKLRMAVAALTSVDWLVVETNQEQFFVPAAHKGGFGITGQIFGEIIQNYPCFVWPHPARSDIGVIGHAYAKVIGTKTVTPIKWSGVIGDLMRGNFDQSANSINEKLFLSATLQMTECNILGASLGELNRRAVFNFLPEGLAIPINIGDETGGSFEYRSWNAFKIRLGSQALVLAEQPRDGHVTRIVWQYMNKDGQPDRRYADNPAAYEIEMATVQLSLDDDESNNVNIHMSSHDGARAFVSSLLEYQQFMDKYY